MVHGEKTPPESQNGWQKELAEAIRTPAELLARLSLPVDTHLLSADAHVEFPLRVPASFLARMTVGDSEDPLLRQVLPTAEETTLGRDWPADAVGDEQARAVPGLLHKYAGRALLILTGECAVHCRYCFRRHYPYHTEPKSLRDFEPAWQYLRDDPSIDEVILSGGDPLIWSDHRLRELIERLAEIPHLTRLRIHSRLPIVLPSRVTEGLLALLRATRLQPVVVVHANHAREIAGDCQSALRRLVQNGVGPVLNQAVLLAGVNDTVDSQFELCRALVEIGVLPYYLHQLDRVRGTSHFEVRDDLAMTLLEELRERLPGYAIPRLVREVAGAASKLPADRHPAIV